MPFHMSEIKNSVIHRILILVLLILFCVLFFTSSTLAMNRLGCLGAGLTEYFVPGLGYALARQWDKAIVMGGARWIAAERYYQARDSGYYQGNADDIYTHVESEDSESGKSETTVRLTKETWEAHYYGNLYGNLLFTTWGDLYQNSCGSNTETYSLMLSPFRLDHFYKKWQFWVPITVLMWNHALFSEYSKVEYRLERGLTREDLNRDAFPQYYMVGVGEEMLFRGIIQHYFFTLLKDMWGLSPNASRHASIYSASAIFAAAHSGEGFTANPLGAFIFGVYEGYVYHPSVEEFDLITAIAIHAWWDILIMYTILSHADFHESQSDVYIPLFKVGFRF